MHVLMKTPPHEEFVARLGYELYSLRRGPRLKRLPVIITTQCACCSSGIRFEKMWRFQYHSWNDIWWTQYLCLRCAPTRRKAYEYVHRIEKILDDVSSPFEEYDKTPQQVKDEWRRRRRIPVVKELPRPVVVELER